MNCERLQEDLYDYLDGSLSRPAQAAAQRHIAECAVCREAVKRERQLGESLSSRMEQAVETFSLAAAAQRRMAAAVARKLGEPSECRRVSFWGRLALPFATATVIVVAALWTAYYFVAGHHPHWAAAPAPAPAGNREVMIHISYTVPRYTFRKEGNLVTDALTWDTCVEDGALLVEK